MNRLLLEQLHEGVDQVTDELGFSGLDGGHAAPEVRAALTPADVARGFTLDSSRYDKNKRFSQLLTERDSMSRFGETIAALSGYMVYSVRLNGEIRPALLGGTLGVEPRLHITELLDGNMSEIGVQNQQLVLSGIAQFGMESIGSEASHDRVARVGAEAGHLLVAVSATLIPEFGDGLRSGRDIVHAIKSQGNVMNTVGQRVNGLTALPPVDADFSYAAWRHSDLRLVWPLIKHFESGPLPADVPDAVPLANVYAYKTVKSAKRSDQAKQLIEQTVAI